MLGMMILYRNIENSMLTTEKPKNFDFEHLGSIDGHDPVTVPNFQF
jgi:hypothetical protein